MPVVLHRGRLRIVRRMRLPPIDPVPMAHRLYLRQVRREVPDPTATALLDIHEGVRGPGLRAHVSQVLKHPTYPEGRPFLRPMPCAASAAILRSSPDPSDVR